MDGSNSALVADIKTFPYKVRIKHCYLDPNRVVAPMVIIATDTNEQSHAFTDFYSIVGLPGECLLGGYPTEQWENVAKWDGFTPPPSTVGMLNDFDPNDNILTVSYNAGF